MIVEFIDSFSESIFVSSFFPLIFHLLIRSYLWLLYGARNHKI